MPGRKVEVFHNNLVLAYILLVGLPLLDLFSVPDGVPEIAASW